LTATAASVIFKAVNPRIGQGCAMQTQLVAVINQSDNLTPGAIDKAAAAVQKQVINDFAPVWDVTAMVSAFPSLEQMPLGYWPVVVRDDIGVKDKGAHLGEFGKKVFALVLFTGKKWTVTLSHEILEMLVDPFGTHFKTGPSVRDDQGEVEYLYEICDPCQSDQCAYLVNGDQWVSDFVTPSFYNGFGPGAYSFTGKVGGPRQVLPNGYMTWRDPLTDELWQVVDVGAGPEFRKVDPDALRPDIHLRGAVDRNTDAHMAKRRKLTKKQRLTKAEKQLQQRASRYAAVTKSQAAWWQKQIDRVRNPVHAGEAR
jgi:hypothetical protein